MCRGTNSNLSSRNRSLDGDGEFGGVRGFFQYLERKKYKLHVRVFLSRYRGYSLCSSCSGTRLRVEARQVKINGKNICQVCSMTVEEAARFFDRSTLTPQQAEIAEKLLIELKERLRFLNEVGLEYLTLDRLSSTLVRRRGAADSAGDIAWVAAGGHALCFGRAFDRAAQPRHAPADQDPARFARSGKYDSCGGARSRHHAGGRPHSRSRPRSRGKWREGCGLGNV